VARSPLHAGQEREAISALAGGLRELDPATLRALGVALDRDAARLCGGAWGSQDDGEGCLLSLAAWELGLPDGEALMYGSIAAVRLPALFDRAWALVMQRTGDAEEARAVVHRLLRVALADIAPEPSLDGDERAATELAGATAGA
jgi:hypothetical protein